MVKIEKLLTNFNNLFLPRGTHTLLQTVLLALVIVSFKPYTFSCNTCSLLVDVVVIFLRIHWDTGDFLISENFFEKLISRIYDTGFRARATATTFVWSLTADKPYQKPGSLQPTWLREHTSWVTVTSMQQFAVFSASVK